MEVGCREHHGRSNGRAPVESLDSGTFSSSSNLIFQPRPCDILLGRGKPYQQHSGNIRLHGIVNDHRERYLRSPRAEKSTIVDSIVQYIKITGDESGRFLKRAAVGSRSYWIEASYTEARQKVSHALRGKPRRGPPSFSNLSSATANNGDRVFDGPEAVATSTPSPLTTQLQSKVTARPPSAWQGCASNSSRSMVTDLVAAGTSGGIAPRWPFFRQPSLVNCEGHLAASGTAGVIPDTVESRPMQERALHTPCSNIFHPTLQNNQSSPLHCLSCLHVGGGLMVPCWVVLLGQNERTASHRQLALNGQPFYHPLR